MIHKECGQQVNSRLREPSVTFMVGRSRYFWRLRSLAPSTLRRRLLGWRSARSTNNNRKKNLKFLVDRDAQLRLSQPARLENKFDQKMRLLFGLLIFQFVSAETPKRKGYVAPRIISVNVTNIFIKLSIFILSIYKVLYFIL